MVGHDWHTGIVLSGADARQTIPALRDDFRHAGYIEFGWGEAQFYPAREETSGMALRAAFLPNDSVLHVVGFNEHPERYFSASRLKRLPIPQAGLQRLAAFIDATFAPAADGKAASLGEGLYGDSRFYRAAGTYHLFNNCNTWTVRALQAAGLPIRAGLVFTADDVMEQLDKLNGDTVTPPSAAPSVHHLSH